MGFLRAPRFRRIAVAIAAVDAAVACGDPTRIYQGQRWIEERQCLDVKTSIDVVEGEPPGPQCGPTCLTQGHPDGGRAVYASTMCGPYPFMFDAAGSDPQCAPALAALDRNDVCTADGSTNPLPAPIDAAAE